MDTMLETRHFLQIITKTVERGNRFSVFHLHVRFCTEKAWLSFQETTARIHHLRKISDLIAWRESFLRRIKKIREKEPEHQIVYTDETWLNSGHRVKKEWIDLKALENPRCSIHDYGTVGCTKDPVDRGKRLIIVDCITEDGPVPGALWTFSTQTTSKKVKKYDFPPVESAVADEKAREMQKIQKQNDHMEENLQASTSAKNKRKEKSSHQLLVNKSRKDDEVEVGDEKHEEEAGILEDFDYHDNINA